MSVLSATTTHYCMFIFNSNFLSLLHFPYLAHISSFSIRPFPLYSYVPDRFFVANEVDWTKYCKGLLLDNGCTSALIGGKKAVVPMSGLPDGKDGAIVYEVSCVFS